MPIGVFVQSLPNSLVIHKPKVMLQSFNNIRPS